MNEKWSDFVISIKVKNMPKACPDCLFWKDHVIEDDTGNYNLCPFGCPNFKSALRRPQECPLELE